MDEKTIEQYVTDLERLAELEAEADSDLQSRLETLRLRTVYLLFDLESSRRENQLLRELLERQPR